MGGFTADGDISELPESAAQTGYSQTEPADGVLAAHFGQGPLSFLTRSEDISQADPYSVENKMTRAITGAPAPDEPMLKPDQYNKMYAPPGTSIGDQPMTDAVARTIGQQKAAEVRRNSILDRYSQAHSLPVTFGTGLVGFMLDPLNAAATFTPGIGEEMALSGLGRAGLATEGVGARTAARLAAGGTAGAAAQIPLSGLEYTLGQQQASDYDMRAAMRDIFFGAVGGAVIHAGLGGLGDVARGWLPPRAKVPERGEPVDQIIPPQEAPAAPVDRQEAQVSPGVPVGAEAAPRPSEPIEPPRREVPIVQFRRDAAEIEKGLPPVAEGQTRLWRGNRPGEAGQNPQFTNDLPGIALPFRKFYGGDVSYVDVPTTDLAKYEQKVGSAPGAEFTLPPELASGARSTSATPAIEPTPEGAVEVAPVAFEKQAAAVAPAIEAAARQVAEAPAHVKAEAMNAAVAQIADGRVVDVSPVLDSHATPEAQPLPDIAQEQAALHKNGYAPGLTDAEFREWHDAIYGPNVEEETPIPQQQKPAPRGEQEQPIRPPAQPREMSLFEYLNDIGGLAKHPELAALFDRENPIIPGAGRLLRRKGGLTLDQAREAAEEAGYIFDPGTLHGTTPQTDVNTLLDMLAKEHGGQKQYRVGFEPTRVSDEDKYLQKLSDKALKSLKKEGVETNNIDSATLARITEMLDRGEAKDAFEAYERTIIEQGDHYLSGPEPGHADMDIPFDTGPAHPESAAVAGAGAATPGRGEQFGEGGAAERGAGVGNRPEAGASEPTAAGEQRLIPGVAPVSTKEKLEAQGAKPMRGGAAAPGGMFDEDARAQADMFDAQIADFQRQLVGADLSPQDRAEIGAAMQDLANADLAEQAYQQAGECLKDAFL